MYWVMLKTLFHPNSQYFVYLDIKDTRSAQKVRTLHDVLSNSQRDFERRVIRRVQMVASHEVEQLQLADGDGEGAGAPRAAVRERSRPLAGTQYVSPSSSR